MLKRRIIPCILVRNFGVVKTIQFQNPRPLGVAVNFTRVYNSRDVDELIVLDIDATREGRGPNVELLHDIAEECWMPLTIGGGISRIEEIKELLHEGADKVILNTHAFKNRNLIKDSANKFGNQCIVVSIDVRKNITGEDEVHILNGTENTKVDPVQWALEAQNLGAGEIYLTSIDHEGKMNGYDLELIKRVTSVLQIPVIANGGASSLESFYPVFAEAGASAVSAASIFHYTQTTPNEIKKFLFRKGIQTRHF